jgi:protein-L-isoaspartate O-methyltransferase
MINFSGLPITSLLGIILRKVLSLIPPNFTVPILQGPLRGTRWIVGAQTHGMWLGSYEIDKQLAIKNSLKPGQVFYDIGANVGYYSLLAAKCVGNTGAVIAFEPLPRNIVYLTSHLRLNKITNTILLQKALSDHSGK